MASALTTSTQDDKRPPAELVVERRLRALFDCLPTLAGFRVRTDHMVSNVRAVSFTGSQTIRRLHVNVMRALVELAECDPQAVALMPGRTFERPPEGERHVEMRFSN